LIQLKHGFEGPFNTGYYDVLLPGGRSYRVSGKQASMISLLLAGYEFREDFHPMEAFTTESLASGRADARVVSADADSGVAEGAGAS
jgi:hypothetical protein